MKKLSFLLLMVVLVMQSAIASDDKPIAVDQLPAKAQAFIKTNFPQAQVLQASVEKGFFDTEYSVIFAGGDKIDFDKSGTWTDIECKSSAVPTSVIPSKITEFVTKNHAAAKILKIELDKLGYDVTITGGMELKFDLKGAFVRYDD